MKKSQKVRTHLIGLLFILFLFSGEIFAQKEYQKPQLENPNSWTLVFIPDVQNYSKYTRNQPILDLMLAWIEDNIDSLHIKLVMCPGDLVEYNDRIVDTDDGNVPADDQWKYISGAFDRFNGKVPYIISTGNHDYTYSHDGKKLYSQYRNYFTVDRNNLTKKYLCQTACSPDGYMSIENAAFEMKMPDGKNYLFLSLEYAPRDTIVEWANKLVKLPTYKKDRIVLLTHSYMKEKDNALITSKYGMGSDPYVINNHLNGWNFPLKDANSGQDLWNKLIKPNNIELVLCGHSFGRGYRKDLNSTGKTVHQILFDTQAVGGGHRNGNGGDGWIRILEFFPDGKTVKIKTFSPLFACSPSTRNLAWEKDTKNEFTITFDK
jgi:hypothetical protein